MGFFTRPVLADEQFKQLPDSVLTLSGQTRIDTVSGLTLSDGAGNNIPINASGGLVVGNVMTYKDGVIKLFPSASGGTVFYSGASPNSITVGGLISGTTITGLTINQILEQILVPTLNPIVIEPFNGLSVSPSTLTYEVGTSINITLYSTFNWGSVSPDYSTSGWTNGERSGLANQYEYTIQGGTSFSSNFLTGDTKNVTLTVGLGNNLISSKVHYDAGETILNSAGGIYLPALSSGSTANITYNITGILPYFYGKVASGGVAAGVNRPSATASLITGGTKVVANSTGTLYINFTGGTTNDDYIWFAIPNASTSKTKWYMDYNDSAGVIGGVASVGGNLFPDPNIVAGVSTVYWSGQTYKLYISNYQTEVPANKIIELRNT